MDKNYLMELVGWPEDEEDKEDLGLSEEQDELLDLPLQKPFKAKKFNIDGLSKLECLLLLSRFETKKMYFQKRIK